MCCTSAKKPGVPHTRSSQNNLNRVDKDCGVGGMDRPPRVEQKSFRERTPVNRQGSFSVGE